MKTCSKCQEEKSLDKFSKAKRGLFGVSSICKHCISLKDKERWINNINGRRDKNKDKYKKDPKKHIETVMKSARKHREKTRERARLYYDKNKDHINSLRRSNNSKNPAPKRCQRIKREASKINATPKWLTEEQIKEILSIYEEATQLELLDAVPRQVDHIIPLRHKDVCGLHVPWNLQVLTASDNCRKSNRFDGTHDNKSWITLVSAVQYTSEFPQPIDER